MCHAPRSVQSWPTAARDEILAVAHRDLAVARRNVAEFTHYLDLHPRISLPARVQWMTLCRSCLRKCFHAHLRGIRSALEEARRDQ